jgi:hypothetical protein
MPDEASAWGVSSRLARWLFLMPLIGSVLVVASRANKTVFRAIVDEDRLLEWLQFVGFAAASVLAFVCAWLLLKQERRALALAYALFGLLCFFIAGEEIAWGQRLFGFGTPQSLEEINRQEEVTVHNIGDVENLANAVFLVVGLYGSVGACLIRLRVRRPSGNVLDLLVPPLFLTSAFFVIFAYKLLRYTLFPESGFTVTQVGEWPEFCLAFAFATYAFLVRRHLTSQARE